MPAETPKPAILKPESFAELNQLLKSPWGGELGWSPQGGGSFGQGLPSPPAPLWRLDMRALNRMREHRADELLVVAEAGMTLRELQGHLAEKGQWLPAWAPEAEATLGGLLATDRTGPWRVGHGRLADRVLWVEAYLADGQAVESGAKVVKSVAGYDWARLLVGSLGAYGLWGAVALKVAPLPTARQAWQGSAPQLEALLSAAEAAWAQGASAVELGQVGPQEGWALGLILEGHPKDLAASGAVLQGLGLKPWEGPSDALGLMQALGPNTLQGPGLGAELRWQGSPMTLPAWGGWAQAASSLAWSPCTGEARARFASPSHAAGALKALPSQAGPWSWRLGPGLSPEDRAAWEAALKGLWWGPQQATWPLLRRLKQGVDPTDRWQRGSLDALLSST